MPTVERKSIRWEESLWNRLKRKALKDSRRLGYPVKPSDVIRQAVVEFLNRTEEQK
jgi:hypothetical protein